MNLSKLYNWAVNGPSSNDLNIDPVTAVAAAVTVASMVGKGQDKKNEREAREAFMAEIGEIGDDLMASYNEFMGFRDDAIRDKEEMQDKADMFLTPGGEFYRHAYQSAVDTAFISAEKGRETLAASGVQMTSYGSGIMQEVTKKDYTETFVEDYMDFAGVGVQLEGVAVQHAQVGAQYAGIGADLLGDYASLMSDAAQVQYMGEASETSFLTDLTSSIGTGATVYSALS